MVKSLTSIVIIVLSVLFLAACNKKPDAVTPAKGDQAAKVYSFILSMGYSSGSIVDNGDAYIVQGDIRFPKDMQVPDGTVSTEQRWSGSRVANALVRNIRIKVDASMTSMVSELNFAVNQYNTVGSTSLHMSVVTGATYDVLIRDANLGPGVCGLSNFPTGGAPGNLIQINKSYISGHSFAQRQRTIAHELGHTIGLSHTNEMGGVAIPGTPVDPLSLMNAGECGTGATMLSNYDKAAIRYLYPL
ncbi:M57 family metalloprotease [Chitinophaga solisilvae]|uniref:M57 family metalloprotease n=1 Tax=Chitinophaga solisilvae TaxID=1233460 RepID=UPI00136922D2|nr:M57 family metalloprotease [Chitinophaga solisilvae]